MESSQPQAEEIEPQVTLETQAEEKRLPQLRRGDIHEATLVSLDAEGAEIVFQATGEEPNGDSYHGLVPAYDLEQLTDEQRAELKVGELVPVYVMEPQDENGNLVASIYQAFQNEDWLKAQKLKETNAVWEGDVVGYNQGGLIVPFGKLRGFVPVSHLLDIPKRANPNQIRERLGNHVGKTLPLRVIEVDRRRRRLVLSYRKAFSIWREQKRQKFITELKEGETRIGRVRDLRDFGAFVDLGGGDGLIHISELAWYRVDHPKEVLRIGQEIEVLILKVSRKRKRIALSLKRLQPHPWETVAERYQENQLVEGKVVRVTDFGAFVELEPGIEGLLHYKHLPRITDQDPHKVVSEGEVHLLRILGIDPERRRIRLSMRAVRPEEQMDWMARRAEAAESLQDEIIGLDDLTGEEE